MIFRLGTTLGLAAFTVLQASAPVSFRAGDLRIQVLSQSLLRLEVKGPCGFEDRPTFHVLERNWPGAHVTRSQQGHETKLRGPGWTLHTSDTAKGLSDVRIVDDRGTALFTWNGSLSSSVWLPGPGDGAQAWAFADAPRITPPAGGRLLPASPGGAWVDTSGWDLGNDAPDLYVFLPGGDYGRLRADLLKLTGPSEMPPLYAFGLWHSRYWPYSETEALGMVAEYRRRDFPLDVLVVDTDWRVGASHGYDENKKLFPDMLGFLAKAHEAKVRVMFNDHPEPQAPTALDPRELQYRADGLGRWLRQGLDIWWYDRNWNVGLKAPLPGLRREVWGMKLYHDLTAQVYPKRRPMIMANVDGIDNGRRTRPANVAAHRYGLQWTGDTIDQWQYLRNAVDNVLFEGVHALTPYVGEDLGAHNGAPSTEFYVRFLEFGALSPTMRLHSTNNPATVREPWRFGPEAERIVRDYVKLRYRLLPVLYAAARRNYDTGEPLLRRLDLIWPQAPEAARKDQYLLGDAILVAPIIDGDPENAAVPASWLGNLQGTYTATGQSQPALLRADGTVDFTWDKVPPVPGNGGFQVSWTGSLTPDRPIQISLLTEGGARLWLNGQMVLERTVEDDHNFILDPQRTLEPGHTYALRLDLTCAPGPARCKLGYRTMDLPGPRTRSVWLPEGTWVDAWTGTHHQGPCTLQATAAVDRLPLYIRDGSIIPLAPEMTYTGEKPWDPVTLEIFPSAQRSASTELYEDDGLSNDYRTGTCRRTPIEARLETTGATLRVRIGAARGNYPGAPGRRGWILRLRRPEGLGAVRSVTVDGRPTRAWTLQAKGGTPFQNQGPAADGEVIEMRLPAAAVTRGRSVAVVFERAPQ